MAEKAILPAIIAQDLQRRKQQEQEQNQEGGLVDLLDEEDDNTIKNFSLPNLSNAAPSESARNYRAGSQLSQQDDIQELNDDIRRDAGANQDQK